MRWKKKVSQRRCQLCFIAPSLHHANCRAGSVRPPSTNRQPSSKSVLLLSLSNGDEVALQQRFQNLQQGSHALLPSRFLWRWRVPGPKKMGKRKSSWHFSFGAQEIIGFLCLHWGTEPGVACPGLGVQSVPQPQLRRVARDRQTKRCTKKKKREQPFSEETCRKNKWPKSGEVPWLEEMIRFFFLRWTPSLPRFLPRTEIKSGNRFFNYLRQGVEWFVSFVRDFPMVMVGGTLPLGCTYTTSRSFHKMTDLFEF